MVAVENLRNIPEETCRFLYRSEMRIIHPSLWYLLGISDHWDNTGHSGVFWNKTF